MAFERVGLETVVLDDFSGGLHYDELSDDVKETESTDCENVWFNHKLTTIPGLTQVNAQIYSAAAGDRKINGIADYQMRDLTQYLVVTTDDDIYYDNAGIWTSIKGALAFSDGRASFATFNNLLVGTNGIDAPYKWSSVGNCALLGGSPPIGKYITSFNGRLVLANCKDGAFDYPTRVYYSDIDNPESWDVVTGYFELESDDAQQITAVKQLGQYLVVYKNKSIGIISGYGLDTWVVDRSFKTGIGCVSGDTLRSCYIDINGQMVEVHIFLSAQGLAAFDGANVYMLPTAGQGEMYKNYDFFRRIPEQYYSLASAGFYKQRGLYYMFSVLDSGTSNNGGCIYDYKLNAVWPINGVNANVCKEYKVNGKDTLYIGSSDGIVYYINESSDALPDDTELITDGDMEAVGTAAYTAIAGGVLTKELVPIMGTQSLMINASGSGQGAQQSVTTVAGHRYRVTAYEKIGTSAAGTSFKLEALNGVTSLGQLTKVHTATWQKWSVDFTALSTTTIVQMTNRAVAGGTCYVDNLSVRCIDLDAYWYSKWFTFNTEQGCNILRELVPYTEIMGDYDIQFKLYFDKLSTIFESDTYNLAAPAATLWGGALWGAFLWGATYLEISEALDGLTAERFYSLKMRVDNLTSHRQFSIQKIHLGITPIGKRFKASI